MHALLANITHTHRLLRGVQWFDGANESSKGLHPVLQLPGVVKLDQECACWGHHLHHLLTGTGGGVEQLQSQQSGGNLWT